MKKHARGKYFFCSIERQVKGTATKFSWGHPLEILGVSAIWLD
jgi:hypothetical protein